MSHKFGALKIYQCPKKPDLLQVRRILSYRSIELSEGMHVGDPPRYLLQCWKELQIHLLQTVRLRGRLNLSCKNILWCWLYYIYIYIWILQISLKCRSILIFVVPYHIELAYYCSLCMGSALRVSSCNITSNWTCETFQWLNRLQIAPLTVSWRWVEIQPVDGKTAMTLDA